MSQRLIDHSPDLGRLQGEGADITVSGAHLLVHGVAYVNSKREIARGTLVAPLTLATTERTGTPPNHVMYFAGEAPCDAEGKVLVHVVTGNDSQQMGGITVHRTFSACPETPFKDYYEKVMSYVKILSNHAKDIDPSVEIFTYNLRELIDDEESVFNYPDANSGRASIGSASSKLEELKIGIIGLGGTGSYVLDFVAKTPVKEIHLFDNDKFLVHNAFRFPGAPSASKINEQNSKIAYLHEIYSNMRKKIVPHEILITQDSLNELAGLDFVFICIDRDDMKELIFTELTRLGISFIDTGIGVELIDGSLRGATRVTLGTPEKNDHLKTRVSFSEGGNDVYSQNIQIAELNALNAAQAVVKWKKRFGFYHDLKKEYNATYSISRNHTERNEILT